MAMDLKESLEAVRRYEKAVRVSEELSDQYEEALEVIEVTKKEVERIENAINSGVVIHTERAKKEFEQIKKVLNGK
jgi:hypothetical protein